MVMMKQKQNEQAKTDYGYGTEKQVHEMDTKD